MKENEKTTKEILAEKMAVRERTPLYNSAALEIMRKQFDDWMQSTVREKDRREWLKTPRTVLGSDIPREMLYTPLSHPDFDYQEFNSNFVLRWEYKTGSTFYFVWTNSISNYTAEYNPSVFNSIKNIGNGTSQNAFMVKFSYWFSL